MGDLIFLVIIVAFFAVAWLLVKGCEKIMGPELELIEGGEDADVLPETEVAA